MNSYELFLSIGEPFAAGLFESDTDAPIVRYANALKRFYENASLPPYNGGELYPSGKCIFTYDQSVAVMPHYANTYSFNYKLLKQKSEAAYEIMLKEDKKVKTFSDSPHTVGGMGWTHSFPNYTRVLREGLDNYRERVLALPDGDFRRGMLVLLEGIDIYHKRCLDSVKASGAPEKLICALEKMPYKPAKNIYEAIVCLNFIYYLDGCDDIGPLDRILLPYYKGEDLVGILREFFKNVDDNDAWSGTLGPDCNEITRMCLRAIHNGRRPNLQLLVTPDMPDWVWKESTAALLTSCGQPAFYNYNLYRSTFSHIRPDIPKSDLDHLAFGGCTETMLEGISAVGSDDAGVNIALVFSDYMRKNLASQESFEGFFGGLCIAIRKAVADTLDRLNELRRTRALYRPSVTRTLLVEDCIDNQLEFNAGGARWVWSCINNAGVINVIDSLCVIRKLIYNEKKYTAEEFLGLMDERDAEFLALASACPSYGNDNDSADTLGARLVSEIVDSYKQRRCFPRGEFYPVSNQFTTYVQAGKSIPATPDGRADGAPLCDSMGAIHGNDTKGPTALLNSVSKLPLSQIIGTPITNIRISKENLPGMLKPLVNGFFQNGGMQLQVSCLSRDEILDAMKHPEKHRSLVVRVGGFSEYFTRLSPELQQAVFERTEH